MTGRQHCRERSVSVIYFRVFCDIVHRGRHATLPRDIAPQLGPRIQGEAAKVFPLRLRKPSVWPTARNWSCSAPWLCLRVNRLATLERRRRGESFGDSLLSWFGRKIFFFSSRGRRLVWSDHAVALLQFCE